MSAFPSSNPPPVLAIVLILLVAGTTAWMASSLFFHDRRWRGGIIAAKSCDSCATSSGGALFPIMDPAWALHEIVGQCLALEDHLNVEGKRCADCIMKHFILVRTLAEECMSLQKGVEYDHVLQPFVRSVRDIQRRLFTGKIETEALAGRELRAARKLLMPYLKDYYGSEYSGLPSSASRKCAAGDACDLA
jgi:hypothetical protein